MVDILNIPVDDEMDYDHKEDDIPRHHHDEEDAINFHSSNKNENSKYTLSDKNESKSSLFDDISINHEKTNDFMDAKNILERIIRLENKNPNIFQLSKHK